jgi:general secretion pathway protein M
MISAHPLIKRLNQSHAFAASGYVAIILGLAIGAWFALSGLKGEYDAFSTAAARLAAMEGRGNSGDQSDAYVASGSPFLEGPTVTIAGADLQRRIVAAVDKVGGNVLSSQIDLHGAKANEGYVNLTASCEIEQTALQSLLFDLEAGMPFLFIEQLVIQGPQSGSQTESGRMRIQIDVAGQWQVTK